METLKRLYEENMFIFTCALGYVWDRGVDNVKTITEEDISEIEETSFMTAEFAQEIVRYAVEIAKNARYHDTVRFCTMNRLFTN